MKSAVDSYKNCKLEINGGKKSRDRSKKKTGTLSIATSICTVKNMQVNEVVGTIARPSEHMNFMDAVIDNKYLCNNDNDTS